MKNFYSKYRIKDIENFHFIGMDDPDEDFKKERELTDLNAPLEEKYFNAKNYKEFLPNKRFHHSDKGCVIEMVRSVGTVKGQQPNEGIYKICKTHNVKCSKTGWELGYYLGSNSRKPIRRMLDLVKNIIKSYPQKKTCNN